MKKCISYVLFGDHPMYLHGAVRNAEMARDFYPGWQTVFFVDELTVPQKTIRQIEKAGGDVRLYSSKKEPNGMFVRFFIADEPGIERFIICDVDSRPCEREVNAVEAWIKSGKLFHAMRDHPYHAVPMLGGMWGAVGGALDWLTKAAKRFHRYKTPYTRKAAYGADQEFLWKEVWPKVQKNGVVHDSCTRDKFPGSVPFPDGCKMGQWRFVGEVFDEKDEPDPVHWQMRLKFMER